MRKVLSFVLVLSLVLGSFSMAFAATPDATATATATGLSDIAGIANEEAIQVNYDLGIVTGNPDGTFLPTKAVNRAEFAAMLTRALGVPDSALAGYKTTSFKDTNGYAWAIPYLAFCQSKGIMLGDGYGNVMPGRTINTNEAVTMSLRAVGYTSNSAELVGTWPSNYVTKAQDLGLYEDVATVANVDKANAAQIIYNTLPVRKVAVNNDGRTDYVSDIKVDGVSMQASMLTTGLNCTYKDEVVSYSDTSLVNTTKYVGAWATVYRNKDKDVVAVSPISTFLEGKFKASEDYTVFKSNGVEYNFKPAKTTTISAVKNAQVTANSTVGAFAKDTTVTLAAKVSGKTITDIYSIATWKVTNSAKVTDSDIAQITKNKKLLTKSFYENKDKEIDKAAFELVGVKSLSDIKADNVVYVYTLNEGTANKIVKVAVGTQVLTGLVQSWNSSDEEFTMGGKAYENSKTTGSADDNLGVENVGNEVKVWLDGYGKGYKFEITKGAANNYAVVTGDTTKPAYDTIVKLFTADGSNKSYTIDTDEVTTTAAVTGNLVGYSLDKNGLVDGFAREQATTSNAVSITKAGLSLYKENGETLFVNSTRSLKYAGQSGTSHSAVIASDVVVYTYGKTTSATTFAGIGDVKVSSIDKIKTGENLIASSPAALFFDKDGDVVAMLVPVANASKSDNDLYAVINKVSAVADGTDYVHNLKGIGNGAEFDKKADKKYTTELATVGTNIQLFKLGMDASGTINSVKLCGTEYSSNPGVDTTKFTSTSGVEVADAGTGYIKASNTALGYTPGGVIGIAKDAKFYEVTYNGANIDSYATFSGTPAKGDMVWVFDTDDDKAGYDVVIVLAK